MPTEETRLYFEDKERCLCSIIVRALQKYLLQNKTIVQNQNVHYITIILFQYKSIYSGDTFFNPVQMYSFSTTMFIVL